MEILLITAQVIGFAALSASAVMLIFCMLEAVWGGHMFSNERQELFDRIRALESRSPLLKAKATTKKRK